MTTTHNHKPVFSSEIDPSSRGDTSKDMSAMPETATPSIPPAAPEQPALPLDLLEVSDHPISPITAPTVPDRTAEKKGLSPRTKLVAAVAALAVLAGGVGIAFGVTRKASAETAATPAATAPATPGNTASQQPSVSTSPNVSTSPTASSSETTGYVRKNNLPQVSNDGSYEQWGIPRTDRITALVNAAKTPEEAVVAVRAANNDDFECYVESWTYGVQGQKLNDFIDQLYTQNPKVFPDSLRESLSGVGPGKEILENPQDIVNDFNLRLIIASEVAQDETMSKTDRQKIVAVIMSSMTGPNQTITADGLKATPADQKPDYSGTYLGDYIQQLYGMMDQPQGSPKVVPLLELNSKAQAQLANPKFTANMVTVSGNTVLVGGMGVAFDIYGDTSSKQAGVWTVISVQSGSYTFETIALSVGLSHIGPDYGAWIKSRTVDAKDLTPLFQNYQLMK